MSEYVCFSVSEHALTIVWIGFVVALFSECLLFYKYILCAQCNAVNNAYGRKKMRSTNIVHIWNQTHIQKKRGGERSTHLQRFTENEMNTHTKNKRKKCLRACECCLFEAIKVAVKNGSPAHFSCVSFCFSSFLNTNYYKHTHTHTHTATRQEAIRKMHPKCSKRFRTYTLRWHAHIWRCTNTA